MIYKRYYTLINTSIKQYSTKVEAFLKKNVELSQMQKYLPYEYLKVSSKISNEHLYLICPKTAKSIANHVLSSLKRDNNQIIAETNVGLGLVTSELLDGGIPRVRMYESCPEFRNELKKFAIVYPGRVELFVKNIFNLPRFSNMDKHDGTNRVESLLKGIPKKAWTDDPSMTIIGTMPDLKFIQYLIKSLGLLTGPVLYGRMQIYAILKKRHYDILTATPECDLRLYQKITVLFQILFDYETMDCYSRDIFLPWEKTRNKKKDEEMVLVKINFKKSFDINMDEILPLIYFIRQLFGRGNNKIIQTIEKWVPDAGINVIIPTLEHKNYFKDIDIFTRFRDLTPTQILGVFREMSNFAAYKSSPFIAMIENELIKSETIETILADNALAKKLTKESELFNYQDDFD